MKKEFKRDIDRIAGRFIAYFKGEDRRRRDGEADLWKRISIEIEKKETGTRKSRILYRIYGAAALAASLLVCIYIGKSLHSESYSQLEKYVSQLSDSLEVNNQVQLLLSENEKVNLDKDSADITYAPDGSIQISKEAKKHSRIERESAEEEFNQIIVPKGKYTLLTLSDGTKMHINSGTRVVYPRVFASDHREIYVEGEVFLNVTKDEKKPFIVKTSGFEVEVLGTSFNVNAYKNDSRGEVVLLTGSVRLRDKQAHEVMLKPDNLVIIDDGKAGGIRRVHAGDYVAWIDGLLISHSQTLEVVFNKLHRFYDIPIVVSPAVQTEIVDGKLDLRQPLHELIRLIAAATPIEYKEVDGTYYINPKNK